MNAVASHLNFIKVLAAPLTANPPVIFPCVVHPPALPPVPEVPGSELPIAIESVPFAGESVIAP